MTPEKQDLVILVADTDCKVVLANLLKRPQSLGIRSISCEIFKMPQRDSGCRTAGVEFLRNFLNQFEYGLLIYDREGSGGEAFTAVELEEKSEKNLLRSGWKDRVATIVIDPELEAWVWSDSPHVADAMNWDNPGKLRTWLCEKGYLTGKEQTKPVRPKEAFSAALRKTGTRPSSTIFKKVAEKVSLSRCTDRAFSKLKDKLVEWFGKE